MREGRGGVRKLRVGKYTDFQLHSSNLQYGFYYAYATCSTALAWHHSKVMTCSSLYTSIGHVLVHVHPTVRKEAYLPPSLHPFPLTLPASLPPSRPPSLPSSLPPSLPPSPSPNPPFLPPSLPPFFPPSLPPFLPSFLPPFSLTLPSSLPPHPTGLDTDLGYAAVEQSTAAAAADCSSAAVLSPAAAVQWPGAAE